MKHTPGSAGRANSDQQPTVGLVEWFRVGQHDRVESVIASLKSLGVTHLRTGISWADWCSPEGEKWIEWLVPRLSSELSLLPCFHYTPPSVAVEPRTSAPATNPRAFGDFVEFMIQQFGERFTWIELWNEPNNPSEWDAGLDPDWHIFAEMIRDAASRAKAHGKRVALGGMCPIDPSWLERMCELGVLEDIDAVGIHGFPGTWDFNWAEWPDSVAQLRRVLDAHDVRAEIWITEAGYSTWRHDERGQLRAFLKAMRAPVERVYWSSVYDLDPEMAHRDGYHADERNYHLGLLKADGTPKLLCRLWGGGGVPAVQNAAWLGEPVREHRRARPVLITGGAGFIGCNLADRLLSTGRRVIILDNLARPGVEHNLRWLSRKHGERVQVDVADVRDAYAVGRAVRHARLVYHFAAQVAVTTSLTDSVCDFEINARGTLNVLEALRRLNDPPPLLFTSTNKVYGALEDLPLLEGGSRYEPADEQIREFGVGEDRPLQFHSPYGCSKGAADQYVLDYARTFSLPTVVFRMSCIYGPHQFGNEDQGWVAHFLIRALAGLPVTLYGDGMQVRDVLFVEDLVTALQVALEEIDITAGQAFNIGGGPANTTSLLELIDMLSHLQGQNIETHFEEWRLADQRFYVSDTRRFSEATGWQASVGIRQGVERLMNWLRDESPALGTEARVRLKAS
jgi:CDP-paratose 2-epimerase